MRCFATSDRIGAAGRYIRNPYNFWQCAPRARVSASGKRDYFRPREERFRMVSAPARPDDYRVFSELIIHCIIKEIRWLFRCAPPLGLRRLIVVKFSIELLHVDMFRFGNK